MSPPIERWKSLGRPHICVIGDLILDRYHWGTADRISPEAPVLILQSGGEEDRLGGAASVATLLRGLDCDVTLLGVIGDDLEGAHVRRLIADSGIISRIQVDPQRPTTWKSRILGSADHRNPHQLLRIDRESRTPIADSLAQTLIESLTAILSDVSAVLVSDYGKGVCTPALLQAVFGLCQTQGIAFTVDPAKNVSFERYRGASLLLPNRNEASAAIGKRISNLNEAGDAGMELCEQWNIATILLKLDRDGLSLCQPGRPPHFVHSTSRSVCDVTGAGDMIHAVMGLCLASGWTLIDAAGVADVAAGLEVERIGVTQVSREEIAVALGSPVLGVAHRRAPGAAPTPLAACQLTIDEAVDLVHSHQAAGRKVVVANGCFDVFHAGHASLLAFARQQGDVLIVAVNSDESVRRLKGIERPVWSLMQRLAVLASNRSVDAVVCFEADTPVSLLARLRPDVLVKGADYVGRPILGAEYCGRVEIAPLMAGISTTQIINTIQATPRDNA